MKNNLIKTNYMIRTIRQSLTFLLVFIVLLGLVACGEQNPVETETVTGTQESETQTIQVATEVVETEPVIVERELGP